MKKIMTMLLATLVSSALFVACGDDDDNDNGNENGGNGNGGVSSIENPLQKKGNLLLSEITVNFPGYDEYTLNLEYDDNLRPIGCYYLAQLQRQKLFSINFRPDFGPPFLQLTEPQ